MNNFETWRAEFIKEAVEQDLVTLEEAQRMFGHEQLLDAYDFGNTIEEAISSFKYFGV